MSEKENEIKLIDGVWRDEEGNVVEFMPVRRGKWQINVARVFCSSCGKYLPMTINHNYFLSDYCPNCGAKMR